VGDARRSLVLGVRLQEEITKKTTSATEGGSSQSGTETGSTAEPEKTEKPKKLIEPLIVSVGESI
jgi:hypothetical protein